MQIKTKEFQEACKKILGALDTDYSSDYGGGFSSEGDALELKEENGTLLMKVSNGTYCVGIRVDSDVDKGFHATIDGKTFLALVARITTDSIIMETDGDSLRVVANGKYKFPFRYLGEDMLSFSDIDIGNVSAEFPIDGSVLLSIVSDNSKEIAKKKATRPVQMLYYVDDKGCITYTNVSACINNFSLPAPARMFVSQKVVKLFRLFHAGDVLFRIGHRELGDVVQTRVSFVQDGVSISAIMPGNEELFDSIPLDRLRECASKNFSAWASFDSAELARAIDRLSVFTKDRTVETSTLAFSDGKAVLSEEFQGNSEEISVQEGEGFDGMIIRFSIDNIKSILQGIGSKRVKFSFDKDSSLFLVSYDGITNVVAKVIGRRA